jgi:hypothetical protein
VKGLAIVAYHATVIYLQKMTIRAALLVRLFLAGQTGIV